MEKILDQGIIEYFCFLLKSYDDLNLRLVSAKNRLHCMCRESDIKSDFVVMDIESQKGKILRRIEKYLQNWPIWELWLKKIDGIGPWIAGSLIILYYYRFIPICPKCQKALIRKEGTYYCIECDKSVKGEGNLLFRLEEKDFLKVSAWWKYMGVHNDETGRVPKRKKGVVIDWNPRGRTLAFHIGESFIKQKKDHFYRQFYDTRRIKRDKTHPAASKMHKFNMAKHETEKLFLAHFLAVARHLEGKPVSKPYAFTIMGHIEEHIINPPFYEKIY